MAVIVKGIETVDEKGAPYVRKDIDEWYIEQVKGERIQLSLFVEALALIQGRELTNLLSYFRLAAIHSAPWCKWDDVPQPPEESKKIPGYCVHNDYTFPTWHRVYMMLYERTLYDAMYEWIDLNVPVDAQDTWKNEADKWRLPFWDFARLRSRPADLPNPKDGISTDALGDKLRLPILFMMPEIRTRVFPKGKDSTAKDSVVECRPNSLYKYVASQPMGNLPSPFTITGEFKAAKEESPAFTFPWDQCSATTKYGIRDESDPSICADGGQHWLQANYALNQHAYDAEIGDEGKTPTLQDLVNRLFQYGLDSWGAFSSTRYTESTLKSHSQEEAGEREASDHLGNDVKNAMSLEFIHNNLHDFVGGTQFLRPDEDHMSLWGVGHMSSVQMAAFDPIFWIYHNNIDRLTAIWQSLNWDKWFDDESSQPTRNNELTPFHDTKETFWKSDEVREWQKLGYEYEILKDRGHGLDDREPILAEIHRLYGRPTQDLFDNLPTGPSEESDDYVITVIYDKFALNGAAYKINLFLDDAGGAHDEKFRGRESEGFVASIYNFSGSLSSSPCGNCKKQKAEGAKCIAQVPATAPMRRYLAKKNKYPSEALQPVYVIRDNVGNSVGMDINVQLHRSPRSYFKHPFNSNPDDPLKYQFVSHGRQSASLTRRTTGACPSYSEVETAINSNRVTTQPRPLSGRLALSIVDGILSWWKCC